MSDTITNIVGWLLVIGFSLIVVGNFIAFLMGVWECFDSYRKGEWR